MSKEHGFTMIEIIMVMVILGILSSVGFSRFASTSSFKERGFVDETLTSLRYAQRLAISSGCHVHVVLDSNSLQIRRWPACKPASHSAASSLLRHPKNTGDFANTVPDGISVSAVDLYFDSSGVPYNTASETAFSTVTSIILGTYTIRLEPETGFTHSG